jgi:hypothetical protein
VDDDFAAREFIGEVVFGSHSRTMRAIEGWLEEAEADLRAR